MHHLQELARIVGEGARLQSQEFKSALAQVAQLDGPVAPGKALENRAREISGKRAKTRLAFAQRVLGRLAFGDIGDDREAAAERAIGIENGAWRDDGDDLAAAFALPNGLVGRVIASPPSGQMVRQVGAAILVDKLGRRAPRQLLAGIPEHLAQAVVHVGMPAVLVEDPETVVHRLDQAPVVVFAARRLVPDAIVVGRGHARGDTHGRQPLSAVAPPDCQEAPGFRSLTTLACRAYN